MNHEAKLRVRKSFFNFRKNSKSADILQVALSSSGKNSESFFFISTDKNESFLLTPDYCVVVHKYNLFFRALSMPHSTDGKKSYERLICETRSLSLQPSTSRLFSHFSEYRFSGKLQLKSGETFNTVERAISFKNFNKGLDNRPSIAEKRHFGKKCKKHMLTSMRKNNIGSDEWIYFGGKCWMRQKNNKSWGRTHENQGLFAWWFW